MTPPILDWIFHLDTHLVELVRDRGNAGYLVLFAVIFVETGVVIMPFLPGDSLLFISGTLAARGSLDPVVLGGVLTAAAIGGDSANYGLGWLVKRGLVDHSRIPFLSERHVDRTRAFFDRHGPKTVVLARFVPVVRTLAPFVAALGSMRYGTFMRYNVVGAVAWVGMLLVAGYTLGTVGWIQNHLTAVIFGIIGLSLLPGVIAWLKERNR